MIPDVHEYAAAFPAMRQPDYEELRNDIAEHGQREPIVMLDGKILDGRHRDRACRELGIEPRTEPYDLAWGDPLDWVVSVNVKRRHMTASQRSMFAVDTLPGLQELAKARQEASRAKPGQRVGGRNVADGDASSPAGYCTCLGCALEEKRGPEAVPCRRCGSTEWVDGYLTAGRREEIKKSRPGGKAAKDQGKVMGVSPRMVEHAQKVVTKGAPELGDAVRAGKVPVHIASEIADAPQQEQREVIALDDEKAIKKAAAGIKARDRAIKKAAASEKAIARAKGIALPAAIEIILGDASLAIKRAAELGGAKLIIVDAPWDGYEQRPGAAAPDESFPVLSLAEIGEHLAAAFDGAHDDGARMAVWHTWALLAEGIAGMASSILSETEEESGWPHVLNPGEWHGPVSGGAWVKDVPQPGVGYHWRGHAEPVLLYTCGQTDRVEGAALRSGFVTTERTAHSQKPEEWLTSWVEHWTQPGDLVLELYVGKSPLPSICAKLGRRFVGAEIDPARHAEALNLFQPAAPLFEAAS